MLPSKPRRVWILCAVLGLVSFASCGHGRNSGAPAEQQPPSPAAATAESHTTSVESGPSAPLREVVRLPWHESPNVGATAAWIDGSHVLFLAIDGALVMPGGLPQERPWARGWEEEQFDQQCYDSRRIVREGDALWVLGDRAFWNATWDGQRVAWQRRPSGNVARWLDSVEALEQSGREMPPSLGFDWCVREGVPTPLPPLPPDPSRDQCVCAFSEHALFRGRKNATRELRRTGKIRVERVDKKGRVLWYRDVPDGQGDSPDTLYEALDGSLVALVPGGVSYSVCRPPLFVGDGFVQEPSEWLGAGLGPAVLSDPMGGVAWTPKGDAVFHTAFQGVDEKRNWYWSGLARWSRRTRRIRALPWAEGGDSPAVSPDGRTLAFRRDCKDGTEFILADLVGAPEVLAPLARRARDGES